MPQELLTTKAVEVGISTPDLLLTYQQACKEKSGNACQLEDRYLFADVWVHPSACGPKLTSVEIKAFLDELLEL